MTSKSPCNIRVFLGLIVQRRVTKAATIPPNWGYVWGYGTYLGMDRTPKCPLQCFTAWVNYLRKDLLFGHEDALFPKLDIGQVEGSFAALGLSRDTYANAGKISIPPSQSWSVKSKSFTAPTGRAICVWPTLTPLQQAIPTPKSGYNRGIKWIWGYVWGMVENTIN